MSDAARERQRRWRETAKEKARSLGICIICSVNDVRTGKPRTLKTKRAILRAIESAKATGRTTCYPCGAKRNEQRRQAAPPPPTAPDPVAPSTAGSALGNLLASLDAIAEGSA